MPFTGYRIYRGRGEVSNVDFSAPVAQVTSAQASLAGLGHEPSARYTYVIRPVLDDLESPDISCSVELELDAAGNWPGLAPAPVNEVHVQILPAGQLRIEWATPDQTAQSQIEEFSLQATRVPRRGDLAEVARIPASQSGWNQYLWTPDQPGPWYLAVKGIASSGLASSQAPLAGPFVARQTPPPRPFGLISEQL
jgi:hypothetical protein